MLDNKVVLITGAAKGMGASDARLCASYGAQVILTDLDLDGVESIAQEIRDAGGAAEAHRQDVVNVEEWSKIMDWIMTKYGKLDGLVNNAGILVKKDVQELTIDDFDLLFDVNVKGTFLGCKTALPAMKAAGGGSIVNLSSISGYVANMDGMSAYCGTKGAVRMMTKGIAVDYAPHNIRVNSVHPGSIETPMTQGYVDDPKLRKMMIGVTPMGRVGQPDEVGEAVCFLLSEKASFMTGSEMLVDGGFCAV